MDDVISNAVIRREQAVQRVGGADKQCTLCPENDVRCIEMHHIAGQAYHGQLVPVCRNCHRKLSDQQRDHPAQIENPPNFLEVVGHFLLGLGEWFVALAKTCTAFGNQLIAMAGVSAGGAPCPR